MGRKTEPRLTSRERLTRGLRYTAVGPVDVTRGALGISVHSAQSTAAGLRRRYEKARVAREVAAAQDGVAREVSAVQQVVSGLPQALQDAPRSATGAKHE